MKILYIHQYFKTPQDGGAIRSWYIATAMAEAGHEVHMITAHNKRKFTLKKERGIYVHYLPVFYESRFGFFRRTQAFLKFAWEAYRAGRKSGRPDLMYITSTPLTVGIVAILLKKHFRVPFVFEVRDIWPEVPVQMGVIRNPLIIHATRYLEKKCYSEAARIVALSPGIERHVRTFKLHGPVHCCPNMSDCDFFTMDHKVGGEILEKNDQSGKFVIGYFGNLGKANALQLLLEAAGSAAEKNASLTFLIIGDGPEKPALLKLRKTMKLENVHFIPHQDKFRLRKYLSVIDAAYISFAGYQILQTNSPNKFFDALAGGKMIISNTGGWIRELIEKHQCGFYYDPGNKESFLSRLLPILEVPGKLDIMKKNARRLAETQFDRKLLTKDLFGFLEI